MQKLSSIHSNFIFITYIICNRPETLRFSLERSYRSITSHFSINHENLSRREKKKKNGHSPGGDQLTGYAWRGPSFRAPRGALVQPELPARDGPEHAAPSPGASTPEAEPAATRSSRGARAAPGSVLAALAAGTSVLWTDRAPRLVNLVCQGREGGGVCMHVHNPTGLITAEIVIRHDSPRLLSGAAHLPGQICATGEIMRDTCPATITTRARNLRFSRLLASLCYAYARRYVRVCM